MSLSYDGGRTFRVIKSMIGGCPITRSYIAWTWFNLIGDREMYMNCAAVSIQGGRTDHSEFNRLPTIFMANVGNQCSTAEQRHTVFANPGPDVHWDGVQQGSPAFPNC